MDDWLKILSERGSTAFPMTVKNADGSTHTFFGMTMRDYFAGQVLIGAASQEDQAFDLKEKSYEEALFDHWSAVAMASYVAADAMLRAREAINAD